MRRTLEAIALLGILLCVATAGVVAAGPGNGNGSAPTDAPPDDPGRPTETATPTSTPSTATTTPTGTISTPTSTEAPKMDVEEDETDDRPWWDVDIQWPDWNLFSSLTERFSEFVDGFDD